MRAEKRGEGWRNLREGEESKRMVQRHHHRRGRRSLRGDSYMTRNIFKADEEGGVTWIGYQIPAPNTDKEGVGVRNIWTSCKYCPLWIFFSLSAFDFCTFLLCVNEGSCGASKDGCLCLAGHSLSR